MLGNDFDAGSTVPRLVAGSVFPRKAARSGPSLVLAATALLLVAPGCGSEEGEGADAGIGGSGDGGRPIDPDWDAAALEEVLGEVETVSQELTWFELNTASKRVSLPMAGQGTILDAQTLVNQLAGYDPGSLMRCAVSDDPAYRQAIDDLGGVTWGYRIQVLEDQSKPRFQAGLREPYEMYPTAGANDAAGESVVIEKPDIVAVTESAALFYSDVHGLLMVNTAGDEPVFECATQLPGRVDQFFFHDGHLVAMSQHHQGAAGESFLLHFRISGTSIDFVETVVLGQVNILDSRRFNQRLVFYTDLYLPGELPESTGGVDPYIDPMGGYYDGPAYEYYQPQALHRSLRVFMLGDTLQEEMHDTLIDTTQSEDELYDTSVTRDTPLNSVISDSRSFGRAMWASDHYFVVTQEINTTRLTGWNQRTYSTCTASHTEEVGYTYCWTEYETRPNPDYRPADNSGGDRSCNGTTLSDCLVQVARVSNPTIEVPVGRKCEERVRTKWICDAYESRTVEYPTFSHERSTKLFIYEYTDSGFIRLDSSVHEITNQGLDQVDLGTQVEVLTTSTESYDLAVPGTIQTLYFQNGFLYVISEGVLQVYAMGGSSIVRTSTLPVVNETLQSSLFSEDKLFLSDFGYSGGDHSTLRVVDLGNPAFPTVLAATYELPGGHRSILASTHGIFTIGTVRQFQGQNVNRIKLGLFSDPYVDERAYLILATDLSNPYPGAEEAQLFDGSEQRLLLPYTGQDEAGQTLHRVGISRVEPDDIVSEGAVVTPEAITRVRRLLAPMPSYLAFSLNTVQWLTPDGPEWASTPVLEYFVPVAIYRLNEQDDYVEIQRLGNRCRLYFANASDINQRQSGTYSDFFDCTGGGYTAYDRQLLIGGTGVAFDDQYQVTILSEEEIQQIRDAITRRQTCLLSLEVVSDLSVDYQSLPDEAEVTCVTPEQLQVLRDAVQNGAYTAP